MNTFPKIQIIPLAQCIAHEGVVPRWVDQIAHGLLDEGVMKNPIVVTKAPGRAPRWVVIDGMHRFAALRKLEIPHVVVYEIEYLTDTIQLAGWDALILRPFSAQRFVAQHLRGHRSLRITTTRDGAAAQQAVDRREALLAVGDQRGTFYLLHSTQRASVERCVRLSQQADTALDIGGFRPLYVADTLAWADFHRTKASGIVMRPHYTKTEILSRTMAGKLFPRKSTRHMIPGRPLRVDVGLPLLKANISLRAKNDLLKEHLHWCFSSDRVRYYPESVFVFAD